MKFGVPWSVEGVRPEAREQAREAARRSGVSLGEWLNAVIIQQAEEEGVRPPSHIEEDDDEIACVHQRLDDLSRRLEKLGRTGPEPYAPKKSGNEPDQLADLIQRLDKRLNQFSNVARAVAEIAARKCILNGNAPAAATAAAAPEPMSPQYQTHGTVAMAAPAPVPLPPQDLSGLEDQLRTITSQIETLHVLWLQPERAASMLMSNMTEVRSAFIWCGLPAECTIMIAEREPAFEWRQGQSRVLVDFDQLAAGGVAAAVEPGDDLCEPGAVPIDPDGVLRDVQVE